MTLEELVNWAIANDVPMDTHIAVRAKDDYFLIEDGVSFNIPYFGNSSEGTEWENKTMPRDVLGDLDYESSDRPKVIILDSYSD
jgi:hypothetical protein